MTRLFYAALLAASLSTLSAADFSEADRLFTLKVAPIFAEKCHGCHGEKLKGGYSMLTREELLMGGDEWQEAVLTPGDVAKSFLVDTIKWADPDWEMPPKENDRLSAEQIADVEAWIEAGAPWPDDATQLAIREAEKNKLVTDEGMIVAHSGGQSDAWTYRRYQPEDIWAFLPYDQPEIPGEEGNHPIDAFIQKKLASAEASPAAEADAHTLLRRASYGLTGLPPTPEQIRDFQKAYTADADAAWQQTIDRLLASDHYGERWAQHWLDIARYADTAGFSNDYERSNAWRYRDYVIRAFNQDKPYDDFVIEQVAGDELADDSLRSRIKDWNAYQKAREKGDQYNDQEAEWLVASSFLRMGPWDSAMVKTPEARQLYVDDVINGVGQTFLATTMRCFKCHDHKFDPLPTRDYYAMYAAFSATQLAERPAPFTPAERLDGFDDSRELAQQLLDYAHAERQALYDKREAAARAWYAENGTDYVSHADRKKLPDEEKPPRHVGLSPEEQGQLKVREQDHWIWTRRMERYQPMVQTVYNGPTPKSIYPRKLRMNAKANVNWRPDSRILDGGSLEAPGEKVEPGVLSALGVETEIPDALHGRRLAVAKWIADERNPITARAFVNRVWQYHFGKPIAGNPNNFGVKGAKPTHPELLDWLAADFVEHGWQIKRLHRLIMTSATYRQSGQHPQRYDLETKDPNNDLLAYYPNRRLSAEEVRDSMLQITGELQTEGGGLPIMPEMNMEVALQPRMIQFSLAPAYQPSPTPEERNRRSIYAYRVRGLANPFMETFNRPNPNDSCEERDSAAVSPQAFTLLNSDVMTARSIAFALRVAADAGADSAAQVNRAMQLGLGRLPSDAESEKLSGYLQEMRSYHADAAPERKTHPTSITRELVEEFTGEPFTYTEILPVFEDYTYDTQAADVDADTRALADLCLLLFNSHEFMYIY